jgi:hypothetical protein
MNKIQNIHNITDAFPSWNAADIVFIESLYWSTDHLIIECYFQSSNGSSEWPDVSMPFYKVSISFKGVQNLALNFNGTRLQQVAGFNIIDLSNNQLDQINFEIEDYEDGKINFYCNEIAINNQPVRHMIPTDLR